MVELIDGWAPPWVETVRALFEEYRQAIGVDLGFQGFERELAELPGAYAPPGGRLLVAVVEGEVAGCGALRPLEPGVAELKRMWVRPGFRGRGVGRALAERLCAEAEASGYRVVRLDTLAFMTEARGLYAALGFVEREAYYASPLAGTVYLERRVGR